MSLTEENSFILIHEEISKIIEKINEIESKIDELKMDLASNMESRSRIKCIVGIGIGGLVLAFILIAYMLYKYFAYYLFPIEL